MKASRLTVTSLVAQCICAAGCGDLLDDELLGLEDDSFEEECLQNGGQLDEQGDCVNPNGGFGTSDDSPAAAGSTESDGLSSGGDSTQQPAGVPIAAGSQDGVAERLLRAALLETEASGLCRTFASSTIARSAEDTLITTLDCTYEPMPPALSCASRITDREGNELGSATSRDYYASLFDFVMEFQLGRRTALRGEHWASDVGASTLEYHYDEQGLLLFHTHQGDSANATTDYDEWDGLGRPLRGNVSNFMELETVRCFEAALDYTYADAENLVTLAISGGIGPGCEALRSNTQTRFDAQGMVQSVTLSRYEPQLMQELSVVQAFEVLSTETVCIE